ncbi:MAG: HlyD family efflux transporter periplasmic adaptor subunit [Granulosicoccus sp.]
MPAIDCHENADRAHGRYSRLHTINSSRDQTSRHNIKSLIRATRAELLTEQQALVLLIVAELLDSTDLERALDAFVGALQQHLVAKRVSIALVTADGDLELAAISQQARVDLASNEIRLLLDVMHECLEHERTLCFPVTDVSTGPLPGHHALGTRREYTSLVSVPLYKDGQAVGVLLLERYNAEPFIKTTVDLLELVAAKSALTLALRLEAERCVSERARLAMKGTLERWCGSNQASRRILVALMLVGVVAMAFMPLSQNVSTHAELVPSERRLVTAPFDGFVESVAVNPGEIVVAGQLIAQLESGELELEGTRRNGEISRVESEFRYAMASHDRQGTAVARARLERERALRAIIEQRLERVELRSPIDGIITNGDPTDVIGAPVTRGDTLFVIAQADSYEVHLMVHESDIQNIYEGQVGTLYLKAQPSKKLHIEVRAIQPVAESVNGASRFRVRTTLEVPEGMVPRPGESGIARLKVGKTNLLRLVTEPIIRYLSKFWWWLSL